VKDPRPALRDRALAIGFDACGFARIAEAWPAAERLQAFVAAGRHGEMAWMKTTLSRRASPSGLWPKARSAIVLGVNYGPDDDPRGRLAARDRAAISVYAQGDDYHELIKGRLKTLAGFVVSRYGGEVKVFVDTAPLMEKPLAEAAGLGWQGKHTNLVSRAFGSWLFLGSILTTLELPADAPHADGCGSCRACLDICPTDAFPAPYQLDARRCLSYLSIEFAGPWPEAFRAAMGNRIYGCDDCLAVCPWNKFASLAHEQRLQARDALRQPGLRELAALDDAGFRTLFSKSPIKRIGANRFLRNVLYAIGNSGDATLFDAAQPHLASADPVVADAAAWAMMRLEGRAAQ
jgi:epoxyqueuosine reductase